jgi:putative ATP-binding cassette transporter
MEHDPRDARRTPAPAGATGESLGAQLLTLLRALRGSRYRARLGWLAAGIVVVVCASTAGQIRLNLWQRAFYDALEQKHVQEFAWQLLVFTAIVAVLLMLVVAQTWLQEMGKVRLREWLTQDLIEEWLAPKRAYLLSFAGQVGENPDQRIQQDAQHLAELSGVLVVGLLQASLLLVSFVGVLWVLSAQVVFEMSGRSFSIPGYMVWCALAYSLGGSLLAWRLGRPLIALNAERYQRESDLRFALVRANEFAEGIALHGGEADERQSLAVTLERVIGVMVRVATGLANLTWVTSGYGWFAIVVPILVAAPGYFDGELSFGGLMMVVGAFNQVQQSLRWFVDNVSQIADWRATLLRVTALRDALLAIETLGEEAGRIRREQEPGGNLVLENLTVALADGRAALDQDRIEVRSGERVLITGAPGAGKSALFRAIAGLWPCGTGTVRLPPPDEIMFMPDRPYLPLGTLAAAICYPSEPGCLDEAAVRAALERVELGRLVPSLERDERWDKILSMDEQQRVAFARLLLQAPRWVIMDDAMSALGPAQRRLVLSLFERELAGTAMVRIARTADADGFYTRTFHLIRLSSAERLRFRPRPTRAPVPVAVAS